MHVIRLSICTLAVGLVIGRQASADAPRIIERSPPRPDTTVVDLGAPDHRAVLRHKKLAGARAHGTVTIDETTWGHRYPRVTLHVTSEVTGAAPGGRFRFREVVTRVVIDQDAPPEIDLPAMQRAYDDAVGLATEETIDARGITASRKVIVPHPSIDPTVLERVETHLGGMTWLPEQAVGVGAKWRTTQTEVDDDGRTVAHTTTVVLASRRGEQIELDSSTSSSGGAQAEKEGLAVTSATGSGIYHSRTDLGRLAWSWSADLTSEYRAIDHGQPRTVLRIIKSHCVAIPDGSR